MKQYGKMFLFCLITMCLVSCGMENSESQDEIQMDQRGIVDDAVFITIGATKEDTIEQIEEVPEYFEAPSCAYEGTEYIYTYDNYTITCYEEDGQKISSILITSDLINTTEGVTIGDTMERVTSIYGEPGEETNRFLEYEVKDILLRIIFEEETVVSIEFQKIW